MQLDRKALSEAQHRLIPILLIIIAVILSVQALKATRPVTMPIAFAFFIAVLAQPLQTGLERRMPKWLSMVGVLIVLAAILAVLGGAVWLSLELVEPKLPQYADRLQSIVNSMQAWLASYGLPTGTGSQSIKWSCYFRTLSAGCWQHTVDLDCC